MDIEDVNNAIREVDRLAYLAGAGPESSPNTEVSADIHARLANAWAIVALARAIVLHADRRPPV